VAHAVTGVLYIFRSEHRSRQNAKDIKDNKEDAGKQHTELWKHVNALKNGKTT